MDSFLNFAGVLLLIASFLVSALASNYAIFIFPVIFALGCIVLGIGKIIVLLKER